VNGTCPESTGFVRPLPRWPFASSRERQGARRPLAGLALIACIALGTPVRGFALGWPLDSRERSTDPCTAASRLQSFDDLAWGWQSQMLERLQLRRVARGLTWGAPEATRWTDPIREPARLRRSCGAARARALEQEALYGFGALGFLPLASDAGSGASLRLPFPLPETLRFELPAGFVPGILEPESRAGSDAESGAAAPLGLHGSDWTRFEPLSLGFEGGASLRRPRGYAAGPESAFGVEYRMLPRWIVRAGARLERAGLPDGLDAVQPGAERMRVGLGLTYAPLTVLEFDLAYLRAFAPDGSLRLFGERDGFLSALGRPSRIDGDEDLFGVTLRYRF
jgi:hypothetical protein